MLLVSGEWTPGDVAKLMVPMAKPPDVSRAKLTGGLIAVYDFVGNAEKQKTGAKAEIP
jgi:hypothetical protein